MTEEELKARIADLEKDVLSASQMLALVLNETGPVEIDKENRTPIPQEAVIAVDVDTETNILTVSLAIPQAEDNA